MMQNGRLYFENRIRRRQLYPDQTAMLQMTLIYQAITVTVKHSCGLHVPNYQPHRCSAVRVSFDGDVPWFHW
jgi:hypothetical protein